MRRIRLLKTDELMKRRQKRASAFHLETINRDHFKNAIIKYLEELPFYRHGEIIDIDIPALTKEIVEVSIYTKA